MFRKRQRETHSKIQYDDITFHSCIIESLISLCKDGVSYDDAFVLEDDDLYVYADIISLQEDVAQVTFQLHHAWLDDPIIETFAATGTSQEDAIFQACADFNEHVLQLYINAIHNINSADMVEGFTQERHYFHVFQSGIYGIGKREGYIKESFWDLISSDLLKRLGNKKVYWVKIFTSKNMQQVVCEVQINHREDGELSKLFLTYAENWDCIGDFHSEKQCMLFVQDDRSYTPSDFSNDEITAYCQKAIKQFERCGSKEDVVKLRKQICAWCGDDSLAYEIAGFIPELYCKYQYVEVEMGDRLFLIHKGKMKRELYQSQLQSFAIIDHFIANYFHHGNPDRDAVQRVLQFSSTARAIHKAIAAGDQMNELLIAGIGYIIPDDYQIR